MVNKGLPAKHGPSNQSSKEAECEFCNTSSWLFLYSRSSVTRALILVNFMPMSPSNIASGDDFVNILFAPEDDGSNLISEAQKKDKSFYDQWVDKCMLLCNLFPSSMPYQHS